MLTICKGEEREGEIFNYLILGRINEFHHKLLFLNTFCKKKLFMKSMQFLFWMRVDDTCFILVIVSHAAVHYSLLYI